MKWVAILLVGIFMGGCTTAPVATRDNKSAAQGYSVGSFDTQVKNQVLDDIIISRRTIRDFRLEFPPEDMVLQVTTAGLHAPYAMAAVETFTAGYFRRFFVMRMGSDSMATSSSLLIDKVREISTDLEKKAKADPAYEKKSRSWRGRLRYWQELGHVPGVSNAPYFIVIAEHRGIPDLGKEALAHCLENMWLKATALDLAFQIISMTSKMGDDARFCALLGLKPGEWDLMGCAIGYAKQPLGPSERPPAGEVTVWLP